MDSQHNRFAIVAFSVSLLLCAASATAQTKTRSITVLEISSQLKDKSLNTRLYDAVVSEVKSYKAYTVRPKPQLDLAEMMLSLGCASMDISCLAGIGAGLKTDLVMYVELKPAGVNQAISLKLVDVGSKKLVKSVKNTVAVPQLFAGLTAAVQGALGAKVTKPKPKPTPSKRQLLQITTTPPGAKIYLNRYYVGLTPIRGSYLKGTYIVRIVKPGHVDVVKKVQIGEKPVALTIALKPVNQAPIVKTPPKKPKTPVASTPFYKTWWFWTIIGVGVAAGTTAGVLFGTKAGRNAIGLGTSKSYGGVSISIHPNNISSDFSFK